MSKLVYFYIFLIVVMVTPVAVMDYFHPTHCEHDVMQVDVRPADVSDEDKVLLEKLGFDADENEDDFRSYRFGSC